MKRLFLIFLSSLLIIGGLSSIDCSFFSDPSECLLWTGCSIINSKCVGSTTENILCQTNSSTACFYVQYDNPTYYLTNAIHKSSFFDALQAVHLETTRQSIILKLNDERKAVSVMRNKADYINQIVLKQPLTIIRGLNPDNKISEEWNLAGDLTILVQSNLTAKTPIFLSVQTSGTFIFMDFSLTSLNFVSFEDELVFENTFSNTIGGNIIRTRATSAGLIFVKELLLKNVSLGMNLQGSDNIHITTMTFQETDFGESIHKRGQAMLFGYVTGRGDIVVDKVVIQSSHNKELFGGYITKTQGSLLVHELRVFNSSMNFLFEFTNNQAEIRINFLHIENVQLNNNFFIHLSQSNNITFKELIFAETVIKSAIFILEKKSSLNLGLVKLNGISKREKEASIDTIEFNQQWKASSFITLKGSSNATVDKMEIVYANQRDIFPFISSSTFGNLIIKNFIYFTASVLHEFGEQISQDFVFPDTSLRCLIELHDSFLEILSGALKSENSYRKSSHLICSHNEIEYLPDYSVNANRIDLNNIVLDNLVFGSSSRFVYQTINTEENTNYPLSLKNVSILNSLISTSFVHVDYMSHNNVDKYILFVESTFDNCTFGNQSAIFSLKSINLLLCSSSFNDLKIGSSFLIALISSLNLGINITWSDVSIKSNIISFDDELFQVYSSEKGGEFISGSIKDRVKFIELQDPIIIIDNFKNESIRQYWFEDMVIEFPVSTQEFQLFVLYQQNQHDPDVRNYQTSLVETITSENDDVELTFIDTNFSLKRGALSIPYIHINNLKGHSSSIISMELMFNEDRLTSWYGMKNNLQMKLHVSQCQYGTFFYQINSSCFLCPNNTFAYKEPSIDSCKTCVYPLKDCHDKSYSIVDGFLLLNITSRESKIPVLRVCPVGIDQCQSGKCTKRYEGNSLNCYKCSSMYGKFGESIICDSCEFTLIHFLWYFSCFLQVTFFICFIIKRYLIKGENEILDDDVCIHPDIYALFQKSEVNYYIFEKGKSLQEKVMKYLTEEFRFNNILISLILNSYIQTNQIIRRFFHYLIIPVFGIGGDAFFNECIFSKRYTMFSFIIGMLVYLFMSINVIKFWFDRYRNKSLSLFDISNSFLKSVRFQMLWIGLLNLRTYNPFSLNGILSGLSFIDESEITAFEDDVFQGALMRFHLNYDGVVSDSLMIIIPAAILVIATLSILFRTEILETKKVLMNIWHKHKQRRVRIRRRANNKEQVQYHCTIKRFKVFLNWMKILFLIIITFAFDYYEWKSLFIMFIIKSFIVVLLSLKRFIKMEKLKRKYMELLGQINFEADKKITVFFDSRVVQLKKFYLVIFFNNSLHFCIALFYILFYSERNHGGNTIISSFSFTIFVIILLNGVIQIFYKK